MSVFPRAVTAGRPALIFILCRFAGLFTGALLAVQAEQFVVSLMRSAIYGRVSIVFLSVSVFLPFMITAYAVSNYKYRMLFILAFADGVYYCFCGCLVGFAYGSAGWLVRNLFLFGRHLCTPCLCWFAIHALCGKPFNWLHRGICIGYCVLIVIIDVYLVAPFLASLV